MAEPYEEQSIEVEEIEEKKTEKPKRAVKVDQKLVDLYLEIEDEVKREFKDRIKRMKKLDDIEASILSIADNYVRSLNPEEINEEEVSSLEEWEELSESSANYFIYISFDLDENDRLIITEIERKFEGDENASVWKLISLRTITTLLVDIKHSTEINGFVIPDYGRILLTDKKKAQDIRSIYVSRARMSIKEISTYPFGFIFIDYELGTDLGYSLVYLALLDQWLILHDKEYLERVYGLTNRQSNYATPIVLNTVEEYFRYEIYRNLISSYISANRGFVKIGEKNRIEIFYSNNNYINISIDSPISIKYIHIDKIDNRYIIEYKDSTNNRVELHDKYKYPAIWLESIRDGNVLILDRAHNTREEALEARFRIIRIVTRLFGIARQNVGNVPGPSLADIVRPKEFERTEYELTYVQRGEDERLWREICNRGTPKSTDLDDLIRIAKDLDIRIPSKPTKTRLCTLISEQYEREYGERARIRYLGEQEVLEREKLQRPPSNQSTRRSRSRTPES